MKKIRMKAFSLTFLFTLLLAPVNNIFAASGGSSVTINFPEMIVLHYQPTLALTLINGYDAPEAEAAGAASTSIATPAILDANTAGGDLTSSSQTQTIAIIIENQWTVLGVVGGGQNIQVAVTLDTASATSGGSSATASNMRISDGVSTGAAITFPAPGMDAASAIFGSVLFNLDISGVTAIGAHTGMQWTITATAV